MSPGPYAATDDEHIEGLYSHDEDDDECPRCHGDGMDPWCDYILPCPRCGGRE